jgi:hypothetical protein
LARHDGKQVKPALLTELPGARPQPQNWKCCCCFQKPGVQPWVPPHGHWVVIVWLLWTEWLPEQSVASQVLVSVVVMMLLIHGPGPVVTSLIRLTVAPPQVSLAVGGVNDGVAGHWMVAFAPAAPIVGGVVSTTVIVWLLWTEWLPEQSVASQVFVSVKVPGHVPAVLVSLTTLTVAPPQVSLAVGGVNTGLFGHSIVALSPAAPIVGGVVSTMLTVCGQLAVAPQLFVAVQVRVKLPVPGQVPGVIGPSVNETVVTQFSVPPGVVAVAVPVSIVVVSMGAGHSTVAVGGQVIVGVRQVQTMLAESAPSEPISGCEYAIAPKVYTLHPRVMLAGVTLFNVAVVIAWLLEIVPAKVTTAVKEPVSPLTRSPNVTTMVTSQLNDSLVVAVLETWTGLIRTMSEPVPVQVNRVSPAFVKVIWPLPVPPPAAVVVQEVGETEKIVLLVS